MQHLTKSQEMLSNALFDNDINHEVEYPFYSIHRRADIAIISKKLVIEVDGSSHDHGIKCTIEEKQADDKLKEEQIRSLGWNIIRFKNEEMEKNIEEVITKIKEYLIQYR